MLVNGQPVTGGRPPTTPPETTPPPTTPPPIGTGLTATYTTPSQWEGGYVANYTITNSGSTPMTNWQLQFDLPANASITNARSAQLAQTGSRYTLTPASYNGTIAPGDSITVGYQAAQTGGYSAPTNLLINGQPITVDQTPTTPPPTTPPATTPAPTGGTVISTQFGTTTVTGGYLVQNNAWISPAGQTINVSQTGFTLTSINGSAHRRRPVGLWAPRCRCDWGRSKALPPASITPIPASVSGMPPTTSGWIPRPRRPASTSRRS
ncbi:hypothetical protein BST45_19510 [Mycobacterium shinjukuense]|uniref:Uncharacterized protein n=1 Tax=Mycobacterium shinjukuense TaxID=398694 RepID=A0A7I7MLH0_9MYCO|nr:hypothetical protein BST45_19510 [Mycobacterium shinjukuense]BBX72383.1 hypothetical protein MSHI_02890 [Mycobacterium shinjukuense]